MMLQLLLFILLAVPQQEDTGIEHCLICHGKKKLLEFSSFDRRNLLVKHPDDAGKPLKSDDPDFLKKLYVAPDTYLASAHGGITCIECHKDVTLPSHRLGRGRVDCAACHVVQAERFHASRHAGTVEGGCMACHGEYHTMPWNKDSASPVHPERVVYTCGSCHEDYLDTYLDTYHGIFYRYGNLKVARCISCHRNHEVLAADDPESTVHAANLAATCGECHEGAGASYAQFRAHLEPLKDRSNGWLFGTAWFMRLLLFAVLGYFALQSLFWFFRSLADREERREADHLRFNLFHRIIHALVILSFTGLCATGLPLSFAGQAWAHSLIRSLGGLDAARRLHRECAVVTGIYVALHLGYLLVKGRGCGWPLLPGTKDFRECRDLWKWFLGKGPKPAFKRFSFMEKFDYWAVFWGVLFIGFSGLVLWFPLFFSGFLPGSIFNWAKIVHAEEAVLAAAYIFAIHFFNTHLKPGKFPMDPAMFTGRSPDPEAPVAAKPPVLLTVAGTLFGMLSLAAGLFLLALLIFGWIQG
jgi:cytochrome b subunit of formate dehydrogenase